MASNDVAREDPLDERLAKARDEALNAGETVVAQEMGDHGQAVVLTSSRVILLKAGLAATGQMNGLRTTAYSFGEISSANLRKGPMGAVIQICSDRPESATHAGPPDNVVIFSGPQRIKKCEAIAATIGEALGKPMGKVAPTPDRSEEHLPSEADSEAAGEPAGEVRPAAEPVAAVVADVAPDDEHAEELAEVVEFRPNPNLPKPTAKRNGGVRRMVALLGAVLALLAVGLAVIAPLRSPQPDAPDVPARPEVGRTAEVVRHEYESTAAYQSDVRSALGNAEHTAAALALALRSGSAQTVQAALAREHDDDAWTKVRDLQAPPGLAGAKADLVAGLLALRTAVATASGGSSHSNAAAAKQAAEAQTLLNKGLRSVENVRAALAGELSRLGGKP